MFLNCAMVHRVLLAFHGTCLFEPCELRGFPPSPLISTRYTGILCFAKTNWGAARPMDGTPPGIRPAASSESERVCTDGVWLNHYVFLGTERDVDDIVAACEKIQKWAPELVDLGKRTEGAHR